MQEFNNELPQKAEIKAHELIQKLDTLGFSLALCESCTAGLVSGFLANIPGASKALFGCFVCYKKEAKTSMLDISEKLILDYGAVSRETACAMADAALKKSGCDITASVTGLAGPHSDDYCVSENAPVGTVWIAIAKKGGITKEKSFFFEGSRNEIRLKAVIAVIETITESL